MSRVKITEDAIKQIVEVSKIQTHFFPPKTTVVAVTLPSGFVIVESSSCVDPDNYDGNIGFDICMNRIRNKVWELEGYRLQCEVAQMPTALPPTDFPAENTTTKEGDQ
jgi:hypothetical protein